MSLLNGLRDPIALAGNAATLALADVVDDRAKLGRIDESDDAVSFDKSPTFCIISGAVIPPDGNRIITLAVRRSTGILAIGFLVP